MILKKHRLLLSGLSLSLLMLLAGCVRTVNGVPTKDDPIWNYLVAPMGEVIRYFAVDKALGFGIAIILVTILVRVLIILPLGLYQSWQATYQAEKRNYFSHIFEPLNKRLREAETNDEKLAIQTEIMALNKEYGLSLFGGMGCLPILIQMPFFSALFYAARYTEGISGTSFLWFRLNQPDLILTAIIAALYLLQAHLSLATVPEEQKAQMKTTMYMMPIMMVGFGFTSPAGVLLYWLVGGVIAIFQQLLVTYIIKPRLRAKVEEEYRLNPPKAYKPKTAKPATPSKDSKETPKAITANVDNIKRNAGKQKRRS